MTQEQLLAYYGESMRLCMNYHKLANMDMTKEGYEAERNIRAFDDQINATEDVTEAWGAGLLEDVDLYATSDGDCRELEKTASERLENYVHIRGKGAARLNLEELGVQQ